MIEDIPRADFPPFFGDEADGAVAHTDQRQIRNDSRWKVPGGKVSGVTILWGKYLHGFQFHSKTGT